MFEKKRDINFYFKECSGRNVWNKADRQENSKEHYVNVCS